MFHQPYANEVREFIAQQTIDQTDKSAQGVGSHSKRQLQQQQLPDQRFIDSLMTNRTNYQVDNQL